MRSSPAPDTVILSKPNARAVSAIRGCGATSGARFETARFRRRLRWSCASSCRLRTPSELVRKPCVGFAREQSRCTRAQLLRSTARARCAGTRRPFRLRRRLPRRRSASHSRPPSPRTISTRLPSRSVRAERCVDGGEEAFGVEAPLSSSDVPDDGLMTRCAGALTPCRASAARCPARPRRPARPCGHDRAGLRPNA